MSELLEALALIGAFTLLLAAMGLLADYLESIESELRHRYGGN